MRIVFVNLYRNGLLLRPLRYFLTGRPRIDKHSYFLKYLIDEKKDIAIYINGNESYFGRIKSIVFMIVECYLCLLLNRINPFKVKVILDSKKIKETDIIYSYIHYPKGLINLERCEGKKLLHVNHFYAGEGIKDNSEKAANRGIDYFVAENNLSKHSSFFNKYFDSFGLPTLVVPYVFQNRFKNLKNYAERKNLAVAVGTFLEEKNQEIYDFFGIKCIHPMRKSIFENKDNLTDYLDCYISKYYEQVSVDEMNSKENTFINRLYKLYLRTFVLGHQKNYYSFNMVDLFNEYKMCIVPEEITGLPAIGFVEAMACGCAFIGINDPMYTDLGLVPDKHYISYNGTLEGLKSAIRYYQNNPKELEEIANLGCQYVRENFNGNAVAKKFYNDLLDL